jgi:general L-amino acid transport system permease protein
MRPPPPRLPSWRGQGLRRRVYQSVLLAGLALLFWFLADNTARNMAQRGIQSGFDFLLEPAGFEIGEGLFGFDASQAYWRAFLTGMGNTLRTALAGIVLATVLGTLLGIGRGARHPLLRGLCTAYVELFRNLPLLLQLLTWYLLLAEALPPIDAPLQLGPLALSKLGLAWPQPGDAEPLFTLSPEFLALTLGLSLYTAAFIAEVVRAGIAAVPRGQTEAAAALGLSPRQTLRRVVLPQALRVIIPPLTNQYLNLTKNSSLAVAIGYPELVSVANTAINQTGRAVECLALVMAVYLCLSLATSLLMNAVNARAALRER